MDTINKSQDIRYLKDFEGRKWKIYTNPYKVFIKTGKLGEGEVDPTNVAFTDARLEGHYITEEEYLRD